MGCEDFLTYVRGFVLNLSNKCTIYVNNYLLTFTVHLLEKNSNILKKMQGT
jgi:hypothetical protein